MLNLITAPNAGANYNPMKQDNHHEAMAEKQEQLLSLSRQAKSLFRQAVVFIRYPGKMDKTIRARQAKAVACYLRALACQVRMLCIISQPIPKDPLPTFQKGSIGESGPELVALKDGVIIHVGPQRHPLQFPGGFEFK
jgi:hypothetical protein